MRDSFIKKTLAVRGNEAGQKWLDTIPEIIRVYEEKWSITVSEPFPLSYNYVAPAKRSNREDAVLKIGFVGDNEFISEIEALQQFDGHGIIRLLEEDADKGVILLERVIPGISLATLSNDEEATKIAALVAKKLWKPAKDSSALIPLDRWFGGFERYENRFTSDKNPLPKNLFQKGKSLFKELLETTKEPMLIHGDFHHLNILSSERDRWLAIDPKGIIGDPAYDLSVFLYNPILQLLQKKNAKQIVERRITIFSEELGIKKKRIIEWCIAQSVLSAIWTVEDNGSEENWNYSIRFAELLLSLN